MFDVAEVAGDADARAVAGLDHEAGRVGGVVNRPARVDLQLADREGGVVLEDDGLRLVGSIVRRVERAAA